MKKQYTYAVARVRAREMSLLKKQDLEQLLSLDDVKEGIDFLKDKGWGQPDDNNLSEILKSEFKKLWSFIDEITEDEKDFELFLCPRDYTNLKISIKSVLNDYPAENLLIPFGTVDGRKIYESIKNKEFSSLPEHMQSIAQKAMEVLLRTNDGQLCDVMIDKAALERILEVAGKSKYDEIREYAELLVASSDIKIAVRANRMFKSLEFIKGALAECSSLDVQKLSAAASKSLESVYEYLSLTRYSDVVEHLKKSPVSFEKWCDNFILEKLNKSRYDSFTLVPIFSYVFWRECEIKAVRMIMIGKVGGLEKELIKERLREMYA